MKRDLRLFVNDVLESINKIESFSKGLTKEKLETNDLYQSAIIRQIEIIGEAVKNIPDFFRGNYPEVSWKEIAGMRDVIIHGYFRVDLDTVWMAIKKDIPDLKEKMLKIKKELDEKER